MKKYRQLSLLLILISFVAKTYSQQKNIDTIANSIDVKFCEDYAQKVGLPELATTKDKFHMRFWFVNHIIDLIENTDGGYTGYVTFDAREWVNHPEVQTDRIYHDTVNLNKTQSNDLYTLVKISGINNIPSDKYIKGWMQGLDGGTYMFEFEDSVLYSFKSYWTPSMQKNIKEGIVIQNFVTNADSIINSQKLLADFLKKVPFECYSLGGMIMYTKKLSFSEQQLYRKERDQYRRDHNISNTDD